ECELNGSHLAVEFERPELERAARKKLMAELVIEASPFRYAERARLSCALPALLVKAEQRVEVQGQAVCIFAAVDSNLVSVLKPARVARDIFAILARQVLEIRFPTLRERNSRRNSGGLCEQPSHRLGKLREACSDW